MHICLISHNCRKHDGQARVNYEIVSAALRKGWRVTFIGSQLADDLILVTNMSWIKVRRSFLPSNLLKNFSFSIRATICLIFTREKFDVVHATGFVMWAKSDVNSVHFVHSSWLRNKYYPFRQWNSFYSFYQYLFTLINSKLEKIAFKNSRILVAVSQKVKREIEKYNFHLPECCVIYNGVDLQEFHPGPPNREKFQLPADRIIFLFCGDIRTPRKNLDSVLKALSLVTGAYLAVAGAIENSPFPALAERLGLNDRVIFLGMVREMPELMRSVDIFLFPSRYEAMSLVLLEALASGLPVITAFTAGGAEVIGDAGIVVSDPEEVDVIAKSMRLLAADAEARFRMATAARQTSEGLTWQHMVDQYFQLYIDLA